jgi:thioredoxin reductase
MVATVESAELVIVGGGPAGLAAAIEARSLGVSACLLEERPRLGGQIYKQFAAGFSVVGPRYLGRDHREGSRLIHAVEGSGADIRTSSVVWGIWDNRVAYVQDDRDAGVIDARCIILASGAFDRPVPFPGWTLPGVMMAGGTKALVQTQRVLPGRRILVAGSGPLILALSAELLGLGASLASVLEAAPRPSVARMLRLLVRSHGNEVLLVDAVRYWTRLLGHRVPLRYSSMIVRADGDGQVQRAVVARVDRDWRVVPGTETEMAVDTICLGYGFQASSELSRLCGCRQRYDEDNGGYVPVRDEWMRTSVPRVLSVGDGSGVGGSRIAIEEGTLAGIGAALDLGRITPDQARIRARPHRRRLRLMRSFREVLDEIYRVGPGIYELADAATIVCRCEDVTAGDLEGAIVEEMVDDPNVAKGVTRAGMGLCQGRYCARQIAAIIARHSGASIDQVEPATVRPPVKPVPIGAIAEERPELPLAVHVV